MPILSDAQIAGALKAGGFPADQIATGVAIALAESGGKTDALNTANRNGSWDAGLMQINSIHGYSQAYLFNVQNNIAAALKIYRAAGNRWTPWATYNSGSYRTFLPRGTVAAGAPASAVPTSGSQFAGASAKGKISISAEQGEGFFAAITNPKTWVRIGLFLMGAIMLLVGTYQMTGIGETVIRFAKNVAIVRGLS